MIPRGLIFTPETRTHEQASEVHRGVLSYFGEAAWTDPAAFFPVHCAVANAPELLDDEPFMYEFARGGSRRW